MTQLSAHQLEGIDKIRKWHTDAMVTGYADVFRLMGPAGTGKTTMAKEIPAALGLTNVFYGTYTGKAAHVLRSRGAHPVSTIHSAIYFPTSSEEAKAALRDAREELADMQALAERTQGDPWALRDAGWADPRELAGAIDEVSERIPELEAAARRMSWEFNPMAEWSRADLIMLDEVSMVNAKLAADIESYGRPILVLGDPAQLPPVEGGGYYTEADPDFLLTEVHRTALDNPITALATRVRTSQGGSVGLTRDDLVPAVVAEAAEHDQVIVWTNRRRWALIKAIRTLRGFPEGVVPGDRIMCLTNNRDLAVFNGQQFDVLEAARDALGYALTLRSDTGIVRELPVFADGFMGQDMQEQAKRSGAGLRGNRMLATFAQAITCHKAQGSEYESVYVVNETPAMIGMYRNKPGGLAEGAAQARRWIYTAITRARAKVTITAPPAR